MTGGRPNDCNAMKAMALNQKANLSEKTLCRLLCIFTHYGLWLKQ
jgi:hypothetical protein